MALRPRLSTGLPLSRNILLEARDTVWSPGMNYRRSGLFPGQTPCPGTQLIAHIMRYPKPALRQRPYYGQAHVECRGTRRGLKWRWGKVRCSLLCSLLMARESTGEETAICHVLKVGQAKNDRANCSSGGNSLPGNGRNGNPPPTCTKFRNKHYTIPPVNGSLLVTST